MRQHIKYLVASLQARDGRHRRFTTRYAPHGCGLLSLLALVNGSVMLHGTVWTKYFKVDPKP